MPNRTISFDDETYKKVLELTKENDISFSKQVVFLVKKSLRGG